MKRTLVLVVLPAALLLAGCPETIPDVECSWELPTAETDRLSSTEGFTLRVNVAGTWEEGQLPAVRFTSSVDGQLLDSGIAVGDDGCAEGCPAGGRYEGTVAPGAHTLLAQALTPLGNVACEASRDIQVNSPPAVSSVTLSPESPRTGDDVTYTASTSDADGDEVTFSGFWTGPAGQELVGEMLSAFQTAAGEQWTLSVVPRDGFDAGEAFATQFTIANTPPSAPTVQILPVPGRDSAALTCSVLDLADLDPDEQELTVAWSWTRDGVDAGVGTASVSPDLTAAGETWECSGVVSDGQDESDPGTASTVIVEALEVPAALALESVSAISGLGVDQFAGDAGTIGSPGDVDGDGMADLVIALNDDVCGLMYCDGQAHALFFSGGGPVPADVSVADADFLVPVGFKAFAPWPAGDLDGDGIDDLVIPHRSATQPTSGGGSGVYVVFGSADGFAGEIDLDDIGSRIINPDGSEIASVPCPLGDVDDDGYDDLGIAAPWADLATGRLYVIFGHAGFWPTGLEVGAMLPAFQVEGSGSGQAMGQACAGPIDVDGNGIRDVVVSAAGGAAEGQGRVLVYLMDGTRQSGTLTSVAADVIVDGDPAGPGGFGTSLAALGDHDGDGFEDFAIFGFGPEAANPAPPPSTFDAGTAWIFGGAADLPAGMTFEDLPYAIEGGGDLGFCGHPAGVDLDGDGLGDLACGDTRPQQAELIPEAAAVRVFFGSSVGIAAERTWQDADLVLASASWDHRAGVAVAGLADRDGDDYAELLVGAPGRDGPVPDAGAVYVVNLAD